MPEHGSVLLYVHGNQGARLDGKPRTATSTFTQLLNSGDVVDVDRIYIAAFVRGQKLREVVIP